MQKVTLVSFNVMVLCDSFVSLLVEPQVRKYMKNKWRKWKEQRDYENEFRQREIATIFDYSNGGFVYSDSDAHVTSTTC